MFHSTNSQLDNSGFVSQVSGPATEPISLLEAQQHLRILPDDIIPDAEINSLIRVAREMIESNISRSLITQSLKVEFQTFPFDSRTPIYFELPPLIGVSEVKYKDMDGVDQIWDSANYEIFITSPKGFLIPVADIDYPDNGDFTNAVTILFSAGYGSAANVPAEIKHAMKMIVAELFSKREESVIGAISISTVPLSVQALLAPFKIVHF